MAFKKSQSSEANLQFMTSIFQKEISVNIHTSREVKKHDHKQQI